MAFFIEFLRFFIDFGKILAEFLGRYWEAFPTILRFFSKNADLPNPCAHAVFREVQVGGIGRKALSI